ncbi:MAG TPA: phospholipase domain-containing protein [Gryllotalpicola sp.]
MAIQPAVLNIMTDARPQAGPSDSAPQHGAHEHGAAQICAALHADVTVDRVQRVVTATMTNPAGAPPVDVIVSAGNAAGRRPQRLRVGPGANKRFVQTPTGPDGDYSFSITAPGGFYRAFSGLVIPAGMNALAVATASAVPGPDGVRVRLENPGGQPVTMTVTSYTVAGGVEIVLLPAMHATCLDMPLAADGSYDLMITTNNSTRLSYRYAGMINRQDRGDPSPVYLDVIAGW